jgi:hypothetical protein
MRLLMVRLWLGLVISIAYRRIRGDMIETYKIINEKYDPEASSFLKLLSNSGNRFSRRNNSNKIVQQRFKTSLRFYRFWLPLLVSSNFSWREIDNTTVKRKKNKKTKMVDKAINRKQRP